MEAHAAAVAEVVAVTGALPRPALLAEPEPHQGVPGYRLRARADVLLPDLPPALLLAAATPRAATRVFPFLLRGRADITSSTLHWGSQSALTPIALSLTRTTPPRKTVNGPRNHLGNNSPKPRPKHGGTHLLLEPFPLRGPLPGRRARVELREQDPSARGVVKRGKVGSDPLVTPPRAVSQG